MGSHFFQRKRAGSWVRPNKDGRQDRPFTAPKMMIQSVLSAISARFIYPLTSDGVTFFSAEEGRFLGPSYGHGFLLPWWGRGKFAEKFRLSAPCAFWHCACTHVVPPVGGVCGAGFGHGGRGTGAK